MVGTSGGFSPSIAGDVRSWAPDRERTGARGVTAFVLLVAVAHTLTYFVAGAVAFTTLTHVLYEGPSPLFGSYLRTPGDPLLWQHVTTWFLPAQLVRGALMGVALSPFLPSLRAWSMRKRTVVLAGLYLVLGFWGAALAAPGNLEGLVYLRPEFTFDVVLLVQPEIVAQGVAMSMLVAFGVSRLHSGTGRQPTGPDGELRAGGRR